MSIPRIATRGVADAQRLQRHAESINGLIDGKIDAVGEFTLEDGETETVVLDNRFESNMVPWWTPTTANAAAALTSLYLSARENGSFTLTHDNTADTDRTFLYGRLG